MRSRSYVRVHAKTHSYRGPEKTKATEEEPSLRAAFGQGMDARIAGLSLANCPYSEDSKLAQVWRQGYEEASTSYGVDARWVHKKLPQLP
jgi:ribosome modulation factor